MIDLKRHISGNYCVLTLILQRETYLYLENFLQIHLQLWLAQHNFLQVVNLSTRRSTTNQLGSFNPALLSTGTYRGEQGLNPMEQWLHHVFIKYPTHTHILLNITSIHQIIVPIDRLMTKYRACTIRSTSSWHSFSNDPLLRVLFMVIHHLCVNFFCSHRYILN